ncbi:Helix-turn-helix domain-containing protein [Noviherbaspirillum humi]|uniref:Helix-turn-helix domain-containing protein n=1 Tax=Noviherbaspirillum humi TaxID=1688639 RepID=A0A239I0X1_9BURK|nr:helix-turn-helix transcriptional regulator [Noviherbaspirillum humi]SNS87476.1 Helix-turn-helix domain-containing protein [Noviherbaspirillum humi]
MAKQIPQISAQTVARLRRFGERIRLARVRRKLAAKEVAEEAGISVATLRNIELGDPRIDMACYAALLQTLDFQDDLDRLAANDPMGTQLSLIPEDDTDPVTG